MSRIQEPTIKDLTRTIKIVRKYLEQTTAQPTRLEWLAIKEVLEAEMATLKYKIRKYEE